MIQRPTAVGLVLCQQAVIEEKTRNVTLVNCFNRRAQESFPTPAQSFTVYAVLTDGLGDMTLSLSVAPLDTLVPMATHSRKVKFTNPLQELRLLASTKSFSFPKPGRYQVSLLADGEVLAQRVLVLFRQEG